MENTNTNTVGAVENTETTEKTYTQSELDSIVQAEADRRVTQALDKYRKKTETQIREAEKLASMDANQKYQYQLEQKEAELNEKARNLTLAENKIACTSILSEKNLPIKLADLVLDVQAETMNSKISIVEKCFNEAVRQEVEKRLTSTTPKNGVSGTDNSISKDKFKKMNIAERQELYNTNRELYNILSK